MSFQPLDPSIISTIDPFSVASLTGTDAKTGIYLDADQTNSSVLIETNNTAAVYIDKFQNFGINTISPAAQLDVNSSSGSCIQLTYNNSSTNKANIGVTSDGKLVLMAGGSEVNVDTSSNFNIKSHNGSSLGLMLGNALVLATADQLNFNVVTPGTASVSKALVLNSSGSISGINSLSATQLTGTLQTTSQPNLQSVNILDIVDHNGVTGLSLGGTLVSATANELNFVDTTPGTAAASKAVVLDASRNILNINSLSASQLTGTLQTAAQPNVTSVGTLTGLNMNGSLTGLTDLSINTTETGRTLVINDESGKCFRMYYDAATSAANYTDLLVDGSGNLLLTSSGGNVDITSHDGSSMGLKLGSVLVTATADQINYLQGTTPGFSTPGKAMIIDSNLNIANVNSLTASSLTGTLQTAAQPNIASVNALNIATHNGSTLGLKLNGTLVTATATQLNYVDTTPGSAQPTSAVVTDANTSVAGLNSVSATSFVGTIETAAQPNITSVGTLESVATSGTFTIGLTTLDESSFDVLSGVVPGTASADKALVVNDSVNITGINSLSASELTGTLQTAAQPNVTSVQTLNIAAHDGSTQGLELDGTLVKSTATQLNYVDTTPGTAQATSALVTDSTTSITGINSLSASQLTGTLQTAAQPNVTSVGTLSSLAIAGDLSVGSTTVDSAELGVLEGVVPGTIAPSKAIVVDSNKDVSSLRNLTATNFIGSTVTASDLTGTLQTADQPNVTSVQTLNVAAHDGKTQGLELGGVLLTATASQINSIFGAGGTGTFQDLAVNHDLTIANADGVNQGLILGSTLVKSSGTELNYLHGSTPGTATAGNALVTDSNNDISGIVALTASQLTGTLQTAAQPKITSVGTLTSLAIAGDLSVGSTTVDSAELGVLEGVVPGAAQASKALVLDASSDISGIVSLSATDLTSTAGSLTMGSTNISESEIGVLDAVVPGTASASKALVLDASSNVSGINALSSSSLTSTAGSLTMGTTTADEIDISKIVGITDGTAAADKALVLDSSKDIAGIASLSAADLTSTAGSLTMGSTLAQEVDISKIVGITDGVASADKALVLDASKNVAGIASLSAASVTSTAGSFTMGATNISESEIGVLDAVVPGTISGVKAVVVDGNKDVSSFRYLTSVYLTSTAGSLTMGATTVNEDEIATIHSVVPGTASASKALVLDASSDISGIASLSAADLTSTAGSLTMGATNISESEIGVLDAVVPGTASVSKALVLDASGDVAGIASLSAADLTSTAGSLTMGATNISESEISVLDAVVPGVVSASKAAVVDANKDISSFRNLTAVNLTGTLQTATQPNVTSVGTLTSLAVEGDISTGGNLVMGSTTTTSTEMAWLAGSTPGTAAASTAMVTDTNNSIASLESLSAVSLSATNLTGTLQTAAQPNVTSVQTLNVAAHDGATEGLELGGVLLTATASELNSIVNGTSNSTFHDATITHDLTVSGADGATTGLIIGSTLVTASGEQLNYVNTTPGTAQPSKAVVVDSSVNVSGINVLSANELVGTIETAAQPNITSVQTLNVAAHDGQTQGLELGGVLLTATATELNSIFSDGGATGNFNELNVNESLVLQHADGSTQGLVLGSTLVKSSGTELNYLHGSTPGTATAGNALVTDSSDSITGINSLSASTLTGTLQTAAQPNITSVGTLTSLDVAGSLTLGSTTINTSELGALEGVVPGTVSASKAVVVDANKDISTFRNLTAENLIATQVTGTLQTAAQPNITSVGDLTSLTVAGDINCGNNLIVGGTFLTSTEIIHLDNAVPGTASALKTMITDESNSIGGINSLTATTLTGTIETAAQPNITSVGSLTSLNVVGDIDCGGNLNVGGSILTSSQVVALDSAVPGTAEPNKVMIPDSSNNIGSINSLSASQLTGTLQTAAQPNVTSVQTLNIAAHDGATEGLELGGTLVTASATELNYVDTTAGTAKPSKALVLDASSNITGINNVSMTALTSSTGLFSSSTDSTSASTGALTTTGGVGITKSLNVGANASVVGNLAISGTTTLSGDVSLTSVDDSTSGSTGALYTAGGVGITKSLFVGSNAKIVGNVAVTGSSTQAGASVLTNTTDSTSTTNGSLTTAGGVGIAKALNVGTNTNVGGNLSVSGTSALTGSVSVASTTDSTSSTTGSITTAGGVGIAKALNVGTNASVGGNVAITGTTSHTGAVSITNSTASTNTTSGALVVSGGAGVSGALNVGGAANITNSTASSSSSSGALVVAGGAGVGGTLNVGGVVAATGNVTSAANMTATGNITGQTLNLKSNSITFSTSALLNVNQSSSVLPSVVSTSNIIAYNSFNNTIVAQGVGGKNNLLAYSSNEGSTWSAIALSGSALSSFNSGGYSGIRVSQIQINSSTGTIWLAGNFSGISKYQPVLLSGTTSGGMSNVFPLGSQSPTNAYVGTVGVQSDTSIIASLNNNQIWYSTDGATFNQSSTTFTSSACAITWCNGMSKFVAPFNNGTMWYSATGASWSSCTVPSGTPMTCGVYYNTTSNVAVAVSSSQGTIWYSTDCITWTAALSTSTLTFGTVVNCPFSSLMAIYPKVYGGQTMYYTTNGTTWIAVNGYSASLGGGQTIPGNVAVSTVTYEAYSIYYDGISSGGYFQTIGPLNFTSSAYSMLVSSGYFLNEAGTGYQWNNGSTSSAAGTQLMQLDSNGLALSINEKITNTTESTSTSTGSLITSGGVGIAKSLTVGVNASVAGNLSITGTTAHTGSVSVSNATDSTSTSTGSLTTAGGVGIAKALSVGTNASVAGNLAITGTSALTGAVSISNATDSTSTSTGSLTTAGGAGIAKALTVGTNASVAGNLAITGTSTLGGSVVMSSSTESTSTSTGAITTAGGVGIAKSLNVGVNAFVAGNLAITGTSSLTGAVSVSSSTDSTNTTNGSIITAGGVGIAKSLNVGGTATVSNATASTSATTGALVVSGGAGVSGNLNVGGNVGVAGNLNLIGDFSLSGKLKSTNLSLTPDTSSPFSTLPLTAITNLNTILAINYDSGIGYINSADAVVVVPSLLTTNSMVYYGTNSEATWGTLALSGSALSTYNASYSGFTITINQLVVNSSTGTIWLSGAFSSSSSSVPVVLSGSMSSGISTLYIAGSLSTTATDVACTNIAVATDSNVAVLTYLGAASGQTSLYYMNSNSSASFSLIRTDSFVNLSWCNGLGKFVATRTGTSSTYSSVDITAASWVAGTTPTSSAPNTVYFNTTLNMAIAVGSNFIWYSTNGTTWTNGTYPALAGSNTFTAVVNSPVSGLLAVYSSINNSTPQVYYSIDAINWTVITLTEKFGYAKPLTSNVAFDLQNHAYSISNYNSSTVIQKIGPINSSSMTYGVGVASGYMTSATGTGYQWFNQSTSSSSGTELMQLDSNGLQVNAIEQITNTTDTISPSTGSFVTAGGIGIAKSLSVGASVAVGGNLSVSGTTSLSGDLSLTGTDDSTSTSTGAIITAGGVGIAKALNVGTTAKVNGALTVVGTSALTGAVSISSATDSTSTSAGSLITAGGVGIAKALNVGTNASVAGNLAITGTSALAGVVSVSNSTDSTSSSTGSIVTAGGIGVGASLNVGSNATVSGNLVISGTSALTGVVSVSNSTDSISSSTGSIVSVGGVGVGKALSVGTNASVAGNLAITGTSALTGAVSISSSTDSTSASTGSLVTVGGVGIGASLSVGSNASVSGTLSVSGLSSVVNTTDASSVTTGSITTSGGVGIAKSLYVGNGIYGTIQTAAQPNISSVNVLNITNHDGTQGLSLEGVLVTSSATELNYLHGSMPGSATSGNALVLDSSSNISGINSLSASQLTGTLQTAAQPNITSVQVLNVAAHDGATEGLELGGVLLKATSTQLNSLVAGTSNAHFSTATVAGNLTLSGADGSTTGLVLGSTLVTSSADQLNYVNTTPGSAQASKALVLDWSSNISGINSLSASQLTGTIQTAAQPNITSVTTLNITGCDGATQGLELAGSLVTSSANQLNYVNTTPGAAQPSKALVLDMSSNIAGINSLSATDLTGTIQTAAQPNITSVGSLTSLAISSGGALTMGSTSVSETDIKKIVGITDGTAAADKSLVLDSNKNIAGINTLSTTKLSVGGPQHSDLPLEVGYTTYQYTGSYAYSNSLNAHGMIDAGMGTQANYSLRTDGRVLVTGEVECTSDRRMKKNITDLDLDMAKRFVKESRPVQFNWKGDDEKIELGWIAQEVLKAKFDSLVSITPYPGLEEEIDDDGFVSPVDAKFALATGKVIPMLTLTTRDLYEENEKKDVKIAELEARLAALEDIISKLA